MLVVHDLIVRRGNRVVLNKVNVTFRAARLTGVVGENGSGKTTFFDALTGFGPVESGSVYLARAGGYVDLTGAPPWWIARLGVRRVFQRVRVGQRMTSLEHIALAGSGADEVLCQPQMLTTLQAAFVGSVTDRGRFLLRYFEIESLAERPVGALSVGQQRLVAIVSSVIRGGRVFLFDEPFAGVSRENRARVRCLLKELADRGASVIVIDHDLMLLRSFCDYLLNVCQGVVQRISWL